MSRFRRSFAGLPLALGIFTIFILLQARAFAAEPAINALGMKMLPVPAGEFTMGDDAKSANWDQRPPHAVKISAPFAISETEVTIDQYRQFNPNYEGDPEFAPYASGVRWHDAVAFCAWLSRKEGKPYRLPTEAEWEYACRAGEGQAAAAAPKKIKPQPKTKKKLVAVKKAKKEKTNSPQTNNVGMEKLDSKVNIAPDERPNAWGIKNMLCGVGEWCLDWHGEYPAAALTDPVGPEDGLARVVRGGLLDTPEKADKTINYASPAYRAGIAPGCGHDAGDPNDFGRHAIGFRIVQAPPPAGRPWPAAASLARQGVKPPTPLTAQAPDPAKPYFRKRYLLPMPLDNSPREAIDAASMHPSFRNHNHSPGLAACDNGDVLLVIYTSYHEYEPEVSLIASRLRCGADQWDMPAPFVDSPGVNDHAPLLWNERGVLRLFWGNPQLAGAFPFNWIESRDSGATWSEEHFPRFTTKTGPFTPQPINSAVRGADGTIYIPSDAKGSTAVLWASRDEGASWCDAGGRSAGRHTTYALLGGGALLGMGGKNSDIDGFMPQAVSADGGKTWEVSKTPFSCLGNNQRPTIQRLKSGRLFFAGDFQSRKNNSSKTITERGAYAALSSDDGKTWQIKKLPGTQKHEKDAEGSPGTLGYAASTQAPNGMIHLVATMTDPCLHYEFNEAWIMAPEAADPGDAALMRSAATGIADVRRFEDKFPTGKPRVAWSAGVGDDGRALLDGVETWFYPDGRKQHEATWALGRKVGAESTWSAAGAKTEEWQHHPDGTSEWTQYWPNGKKKAHSTWRNFMCDGKAEQWDENGKPAGEHSFKMGKME